MNGEKKMENSKLKKYLIRTFAISWISWSILALLVKNDILVFSSMVGAILFIIGGFAPTISAISLQEKKSFKAIINFIFTNKKKSIKYLLLFCLFEVLTIGLSSMELNPGLPLYTLPFVFLVCTFVGGGNEELGWRGTMQPILERKVAFPVATLITGIVWSIWHLPLWFIEGTTQQNIPFLLFSVYAIFLSYWLACVYKKTNCVFYCAILHGLSNLLMSMFFIKVNWILVLGLILMDIFAIVLWYKTEEGQKAENLVR